ncbi:MAG: hypothetical protein ACPG19_06040, partial [Saprospiraceae bacterium]
MTNTKQVNYVGNYDKINPDFWKRVEGFFIDKGYDIKACSYDIEAAPDILLILNPYSINDYFYDIHLLWVSYFKENDILKNTKVIISGFAKECPAYKNNYISFIDFEKKFSDFYVGLKTLGELKTLEELSKDEENHITRANILKALVDFFQGHHDRSLFQRFNYLEMAMKNIYYTTTGEVNRTFDYAIDKMKPIAINEWKNFENRWMFYRNFLHSTPFTIEGKQIEKAIIFLRSFLKGNKKIEESNIQEIVSQIAMIRDNLNEMEKYV